VLRWITVTHTQRWHAHHHTAEPGIYQGRFESIPVQIDEHVLTAARYVERNALQAHLADRAKHCWVRRMANYNPAADRKHPYATLFIGSQVLVGAVLLVVEEFAGA
jgi:hypothetical protein